MKTLKKIIANTAPVNAAPVKKVAAVAPIQLLEGGAVIDKAILSFARKGKALDDYGHMLACSIVQHVFKHRESSLVNKMIEALPQQARSNALKEYFESNSPITWDAERKAFVFSKERAKIMDATDSITQAKAIPFYTFKKEAEYKPLDLNLALAVLIKRAEKRLEAGLQAGDNIDPASVAAIKALIPTVSPATVQ